MNVFQNPMKSIPKEADSQIVRITMKQNEVGGRTSHIPSGDKSSVLSIEHVAGKGA